MKTLTVTKEDAGMRLDKFLVDQLPEESRSQIKKMILADLVQLNDSTPSVHQFLKEGDIVTIHDKVIEIKKLPDIEIIDQGDGYVVINKPAGALVHATPSSEGEETLRDWLIQTFPEAKGVGEEGRDGIVHRLDRTTSGVMLMATSQKMFDHLKQQFKNQEVHKTYIGLAHGEIETESGEIKSYIGRSTQENRMASRVKPFKEKDREALTRYEVKQRFMHYSLVEAFPSTGRTHQIRVHLMSIGHPLVGDTVYTVRGQKQKIDLGRVFLHAKSISFKNLDNEELTYEAPLPLDLLDFLNELKTV